MIALTPGQAGDGPQAEPLLEAVLVTATDGDSKDDSRLKEARRLKETPCISAVRGDKGYDSDALIAYIEALKAKPVIPSKKNRLTPRASDPELYKDRNKIERFIGGGGSSGGGGGAGGANGGAQAAMQTAAASEAVQPEPTELREHYLAARLTDASGRPVVSQWRCVTDADGVEDDGFLPGNGQVRRNGMDAEGDSTVVPRAVFGARWSTDEACVGEAVTVTAKAVGFEDGTDVVIDVQRIGTQSGSRSSIDTVLTKVSGEEIEATWTFSHDDIDVYDPEAPEPLPTPAGEAPRRDAPRFVAAIMVTGAPTTIQTAPLAYVSTLTIGLDDGTEGVANEPYVVRFSNGEVRRGRLDGDGRATLDDVPPCTHEVTWPRRDDVTRSVPDA